MSETTLRWKGRLGSLKALALVVLILAIVVLIGVASDLSMATSNPTEPQAIKIGQVVKGDVGAYRYVQVSGLAFYSEVYRETENGNTVSQFYFVIDQASGDMILVKAAKPLPATESQAQATISGLTRPTDSQLQSLIESDFAAMHQANLQANSQVYLVEGEKPADVGTNTALVVLLVALIILCVATFFFPATVFGPKPIDREAASAAVGNPGVKATGRFQKLAGLQPSFTFGKGMRQFNNAVANIVPLNDRSVMMYIHHVLTYRTYSVKIRQQESDWGIVLDPARVQEAEPGKTYAWRDRHAVRVRYADAASAPGSKPQTLIVTFNHAGAQQDFVNLLRQRGFAVGTGDAPLV